jgi:integrase
MPFSIILPHKSSQVILKTIENKGVCKYWPSQAFMLNIKRSCKKWGQNGDKVMAWNTTKYPGVRYRSHKTRKVGVKFDHYYVIRYQKDGKRIEEALGWASEGWSVEKANTELGKLREAARLGEGSISLKEKRAAERIRKEEEQGRAEAQKRAAVSFKDYFENIYFPDAKLNKKKGSYDAEKFLFDGWIDPVIGSLPFSKILPLNIRAIKKKMTDAGKSTSTIKYAYAVISQVWNHARSDGLVSRDCPIKDKTAKLPKINNSRTRFLTHEEADKLLADLKISSKQLHDMALLSLHCGLRAGEIFKLTWDCVDFKQGAILLKDTKAKNSRYAYMTSAVKEMFAEQERVKRGLVFRSNKKTQIKEVSASFDRVVKRLKFNVGVDDRRAKVVFHTLRHTFASWHVMGGTDLYVVKNLLGHSTIKMTERYAHLQEGSLKQSVKAFEQTLIVEEPEEDNSETGTN